MNIKKHFPSNEKLDNEYCLFHLFYIHLQIHKINHIFKYFHFNKQMYVFLKVIHHLHKMYLFFFLIHDLMVFLKIQNFNIN